MTQPTHSRSVTERRALSSELSIALSFPVVLATLVWLAMTLATADSHSATNGTGPDTQVSVAPQPQNP